MGTDPHYYFPLVYLAVAPYLLALIGLQPERPLFGPHNHMPG